MKIDIFKKLEPMKNQHLKRKLIDRIMTHFIPFNRGLKYTISELSENKVQVESPDKKRRQNHLKGAHACAIALLGEYPAGLLLAQIFSIHDYRLIMCEINVKYFKQGRGHLYAVSKRPEGLIESINEEAFFEMNTDIFNSNHEKIALCQTKWQLKSWDLIKSKKN